MHCMHRSDCALLPETRKTRETRRNSLHAESPTQAIFAILPSVSARLVLVGQLWRSRGRAGNSRLRLHVFPTLLFVSANIRWNMRAH